MTSNWRIIAHNWIYLLQLNPCPELHGMRIFTKPYPLLHVVFFHLSCSKSTYSKPSAHQIHGTGNINISLLDSWTPKPWKIKVLSPSNMGYNPYKMKGLWVPMDLITWFIFHLSLPNLWKSPCTVDIILSPGPHRHLSYAASEKMTEAKLIKWDLQKMYSRIKTSLHWSKTEKNTYSIKF